MMQSVKGLLSIVFSVLTNRWFVFFAVFISSRVIIGHFFDLRSRCEDGWFSPSIGIQGHVPITVELTIHVQCLRF